TSTRCRNITAMTATCIISAGPVFTVAATMAARLGRAGRRRQSGPSGIAGRAAVPLKPLLEEDVRIGIVVEALDLGPAAGAIKLTRFRQSAVGIQPQNFYRNVARGVFD